MSTAFGTRLRSAWRALRRPAPVFVSAHTGRYHSLPREGELIQEMSVIA
jgi:hypothetical protein